MKRALVVLLLAATAHAQPAWDSTRGWSTNDPALDRMRAEHRRRFDEAQRDITSPDGR